MWQCAREQWVFDQPPILCTSSTYLHFFTMPRTMCWLAVSRFEWLLLSLSTHLFQLPPQQTPKYYSQLSMLKSKRWTRERSGSLLRQRANDLQLFRSASHVRLSIPRWRNNWQDHLTNLSTNLLKEPLKAQMNAERLQNWWSFQVWDQLAQILWTIRRYRNQLEVWRRRGNLFFCLSAIK